MEKPPKALNTKHSIYEQDELEDETLQLIVHPNKNNGTNMFSNNLTSTVGGAFEYIHPNCLTFNGHGRLFVGDSRGHISVWDISLKHGKVYADNYFKIRQKELEGDEINQIIVHPEYQY
jgi:hypothetical protein